MSVAPGTRLGSFEVLSKIDAGGMGEVYRAREERLKREVAIKILPEELSGDADRIARFEREALVLASLNHPNIGAIYRLEKQAELVFLVLELIEGETLGERLRRGPLPLREALLLFRQIAMALEAAHTRGIMHRDLKPDNVMITGDGFVKVLDFGLAKEVDAGVNKGSASKTDTAPEFLTRSDHILGTPAYMSPEQARGQPLDSRTDIWAFGCCLFQTIAGQHPFPGSHRSDVLVAVLTHEPNFDALPAGLPPGMVKLLRRCLQKEASRRLRDIGDARIEIEEELDRPSTAKSLPVPVPPTPNRTFHYRWLASGLAFGLAAGILMGRKESPSRVTSTSVRRFTLDLPPTERLALDSPGAIALAPDGSRLAHVVRFGDTTELRLRSFDRLEPVRLPLDDGAQSPLFEPSGERIVFVSGEKLMLMSPNRSPEPLADCPGPRGASWLSNRIVFACDITGGLSIVEVSSRKTKKLTAPSGDEQSHRWPSWLPDGRHALFTVWSGESSDVEVVDVDTGERKLLVRNATSPRYSPTGHLVFVRDSSLMAAPFDLDRLEPGQETPVVEGIHVDRLTRAGVYDLAEDGTLVYAPKVDLLENEAAGQVLSIDRHGKGRVVSPELRGYQVPRLSANDQELLLTVTESDETDVWVMNLYKGALHRVTFDGSAGAGVWNPDGQRITYTHTPRDGRPPNLFVKLTDDPGPGKPLAPSPNAQFAGSWSPDGKWLAYTELDPNTQLDVWVWSAPSQKRRPLLHTSFNESSPAVSPDGRYLAYVSNETGENEVFVCTFPACDRKWPISAEGGREPVWSDDGSELFYRDDHWMNAVSIETEPSFSQGASRHQFEAPYDDAGATYANYDSTRDGREFMMVQSVKEATAAKLVVVLNWSQELKSRLPNQR